LRRVSAAPPRPDPGGASLSRRVKSLLVRPLVRIDAAASIRAAAQLMTRERVSCLIVEAPGSLGIVTDRDLRSRVVATSADPGAPVSSIMSSPVASVDARASLLEASMQMMRLNVHHLAVFDAGAPVGVVTLADLVQSHVANPVYLLGEISKQETLDGLIRASRRRADVLLQMVASDATALDTHQILTQIGDAITRRLIEIVWKELAADEEREPVGRYCWVAFGSQARQEHALGSDQDNALIFTDPADNSSGALTRLAERVCDGLDACGYPRCKGEIMACVPRWCQPRAAWKEQFTKWIREPTKEAVMRGSIFFDMRAVHGDPALVEELGAHVLKEISSHPLFLALLAHNSLERKPPLGFFRQLVVESSGEHESTLNLKHRGLIPIVDLARVYGLEAGCSESNTLVRLRRAVAAGVLSETGCTELTDAYEFIGSVRLRLQAQQLRHGKPATNYLDPNDLTSAERAHLRDAFSVVRTIQSSLERSRQLSLLGA
jgi:CBS domain-containing protein